MTQHPGYKIAGSVVVLDPDGRMLIVREGDPRVLGKLNLPGGHLDEGESILDCAVRETREETGLTVVPTGLLGVYVEDVLINFVYLGHSDTTTTVPGEDIESCEWLSPEEIAKIPDSGFLRPEKMRSIIADVVAGRVHSIDLIQDMNVEK